MKVLLLVHIEETFRNRLSDGLIKKIINFARKCDKVIHFTSCVNDYEPIYELQPYITESVQWGWGYEPECFETAEEELEYLIESSGHEYTWIPPELRDNPFKNDKVYLGGGCDGECLADMESVLSFVNVDFDKRNELVYS